MQRITGRSTLHIIMAMLLCLLYLGCWGRPAYAADTVYRAELDGEVGDYMVAYMERVYDEAAQSGADAVLLDLDTYGGYVTAAVSLKQLIMDEEMPTYCYINDKAISAGALIALSCDGIAVNTGGTIGAAEPRLGGEKADEKVVSFWTAELVNAAETNGRDSRLAAAMSDSSVVIAGLSEEGKLLTLTAQQAVDRGIADSMAATTDEALAAFGLQGADIITAEPNMQENLTQILNNSVVSTLLLSIGIGCMVLEVMFAGVGMFAALGITSLALYFIGALLLSYTAWIAIALAVAGLVLLILEIFVVPGFGLCGVLGIASIIGAVICVAPSITVALLQIAIAIAVTVLLVIISLKCGRTRRVWSRLILKDSTSTEGGYLSQPLSIRQLVGQSGVALTDLRPSGAALLDGRRTDVLTEGEFIKRGTAVQVIRVDGSSVVVIPIDDDAE